MARFIMALLPEYNMKVSLLIKMNLTVTEMVIFEFLLQGKDVSLIATYRQKSPKNHFIKKLVYT